MRLVPRTLAARMTAVLLLGLVLAQLLSTAVDILDRGKAFYRSTTLQVAEHISDLAKMLDAVRPEDRAQVVRKLSERALSISLSRGADAPARASLRPYEHAFAAMVSQDLGPGRLVQVQLHRTPRAAGQRPVSFADAPANVLDRYLTLQFFYPVPRGFSVVTSIQLHDASWVTFSAPLPYEHVTRFYVLLPKLALMLAIVIALMLAAIRWVTDPMKKMGQAALALGQDLDRPPLKESGPEEVRATARALNVMQLRLQNYLRDRSAMLAALSHDLKTYITRLRLRSELLPEGDHRDRLIGDLGNMAGMVDATLDYLRGVNPHGARSLFDVMALIESVRIDAEDMGWQVAVAGTIQGTFLGNVQELRRCLMNLVENAVKYAGSATIRLEESPEELAIGVCDPGPGIPPEERERVFEPFYRSGSSELSGAGLGLNIARSIARAHGGDIILQADTPYGFCATIRLPRLR